jgi:hypothetical protein
MPATQTIVFNAPSISEIGSGTITAFLFSGTTLSATLASITENGTLKGQYTGTVTDIAAGTYRVVVKYDGFTVSKPEYSVILALATATYTAVMDFLALGTQVFGHSYLESIKRIEIVAGGATLSGAGTGTEVMTSSDGSKTATFTADQLGNVSALVFT